MVPCIEHSGEYAEPPRINMLTSLFAKSIEEKTTGKCVQVGKVTGQTLGVLYNHLLVSLVLYYVSYLTQLWGG